MKRSDAVAGLKTTLNLLKEVLDDCPLPGPKAAVNGVVALLGIAQDIKANANDIAEVSKRLRHIQQKIIEPINDFAARESPEIITEAMNKRMDELGREIDKMLITAVEMHKRSPLGRIANHEADKDLIAGLNNGLDQLFLLLNTESTLANEVKGEQILHMLARLDIASIQTVPASLRNLENLAKAQQAQYADADTVARVNSLPRADARYDSGTRTGAAGCLEGTRTQLLRTIRLWLDQEDGQCPPIFWLFGEAGIGKSTVAHTIASELDQCGRLAGSFFFSRDDVARQNHLLVVPTIAHRLAQLDARISCSISAALKADADVAKAVPSKQLAELIAKPIRSCSLTSERTILVVIDALDECSSEEGAEVLVKAWQAALLGLPRVRLLITSRPKWSLQQRIKKDTRISRSFQMHDIDHFVATGDIKRYLRHNLTLIAQDWSIARPWPSEKDTAELIKKCGVLFIVASTSVKFLRDDEVYDPEAQLVGLLSGADGTCIGPSPNEDMDFLYRRILRLVAQKPNVRFFEVFQSIVGAIVFLRKPLAVGVISKLMGVAENDVLLTLRRLSSVIRLPDNPEDPIQFFHPSFPEFLCNPNRCDDSRFLIISQDASTRLSQRCMSLLIQVSELHVPFDIFEQNQREAFRYARRNCYEHLQQASDENEDLKAQLRSVYCSGLLEWWQFFAVTSQTYVSVMDETFIAIGISANLSSIATNYFATFVNTNADADPLATVQMQKSVLEQFVKAYSDREDSFRLDEPGYSAIILAIHLHQSVVSPFVEVKRPGSFQLEISKEQILAIERVGHDAAAVLSASQSAKLRAEDLLDDESSCDTLQSYLDSLLHCLKTFADFDDRPSPFPPAISVRDIARSRRDYLQRPLHLFWQLLRGW